MLDDIAGSSKTLKVDETPDDGQTLADRDQTLADGDQSGADSDQTAADVLSQGEGRGALSISEFRPTGTGAHADILAEIGAGHAVGFGTPATLAVRASHLRLLPFDPALTIPTYISWRPQRSPVVDACVAQLSTAT
jgi:hypothetical protein